MRVLIISDTHGHDKGLYEVLKIEKNIDHIIHLGDIGDLEDYIEETTGLACFAVKGNNDYASTLPYDSVVMLGRHRTFITHGHHYGVGYSFSDLKRHAQALECDIVLFGHTHIPEIVQEGKYTFANPGSLSLPRQPGRQKSYIIAEIDNDGEVNMEIKYLN